MVDARRRAETIGRGLKREVARAYYLHDRSKVQIAAQTGLSRWQVARALREAREEGIVTIRVEDAESCPDELGERLRVALGVREVVVAAEATDAGGRGFDAEVAAVAQALADHLERAVRPGETVAVGWSRVIEAMPARLRRMSRCDVVQLAGALTFAGDRVGSVEVIRQVARTAGGTAYPVYAPLVAPDPAIAASLLAADEIADVTSRARRADHAVTGIGTWTREGSTILPLLPPGLVQQVAEAGAAAVVSGRVMDEAGQPLDEAVGVDDRIVGLTLEQLRGIPDIIATCVGRHRPDAVRAAVRGGLVDVLIVDEGLARALLDG